MFALITKVDGQTEPLMAALLDAFESADLTLDQATATLASAESMVGDGSEVRFGLDNTRTEISGTARSIRIFADYLERHPLARSAGRLLGKSADPVLHIVGRCTDR